MEKNKFEFKKLELPPKEILIKENTSLDIILNNREKSYKHKQTSNFQFAYLFMTAIVFTIVGYFLHHILEPAKPISTINSTNGLKIDSNHVEKAQKPTYFNYFDSMLFLNQVKGTKKVVSKGYDDYIKKNKLIVKANDYYYNLFCEDLINNYEVGDSIP